LAVVGLAEQGLARNRMIGTPPTLRGDNRGAGEFPAGTVTMLFSDIEGSTALLTRLGER
jgi:class 3 adenylate cyclase